MVIYRCLNQRGRVCYKYPANLDEALRLAARDHNYGNTVDEILDNNRRYNRQEILGICDRMGLLR